VRHSLVVTSLGTAATAKQRELMVSAEAEAALGQIGAIAHQRDRIASYRDLVEKLTAAEALDDLCACFDRVFAPDEAQVVARQVAAYVAEKLGLLSASHPEPYRDAAQRCLQKLAAQPVAYDDAEHALRLDLFENLVADEQYKEAAAVLGALNLEGATGRSYDDADKAQIYVKIAEAYLQDDLADKADAFVTRASGVMGGVADVALQLRYRTTSARVLDANRKFLDAALRFHELSQTQHGVVQEDLLELLGLAITCAVLGKAGAQRSRILGTLFKDERLRLLEQLRSFSTHAQVLTKMYKEQILRTQEMEVFEKSLADHHKATAGDGLTIPRRAVVEHNMVAAGRIYDNIGFVELGALLELSPAMAEKVAARMIAEGRLHGRIDQVAGMLHFFEGGGGGGGSGGDRLLHGWDERIAALCQRVNLAHDAVATVYPHIAEAAVAAPS
ncbi:unnamed protein product, partial [Phaeothamnion confervicola]